MAMEIVISLFLGRLGHGQGCGAIKEDASSSDEADERNKLRM